jgi:hypothetical protein
MDGELIKQLLRYDPETGNLHWLQDRIRHKAGSIAGGVHKGSGYIRIEVAGKGMSAHRVAWFLHYGYWPKDQLDHINQDKRDNRIENLREATNGQNRANTRSSSRHGLKGVAFKPWLKKRPWEARITSGKRVISLGCYATKEEAHQAYCEAAKRLHGDFFSA